MKLMPNTELSTKDSSPLTKEECRSSIARDLEIEISRSSGNIDPELVPEQYEEQVPSPEYVENENYRPTLPVITIVLQILHDKDPPHTDNVTYGRQEILPGEMTSAWRVISFFFVIFVLPTILISVPLYARYKLYSPKTLYFTNGDMHSLHKDVSRFWCQGQRIISNGTFEAFLTSQPRRMSLKRRKRKLKLSSELLFMEDDVEQWGFYLIKGSRFTFSSCARWPGGTLLVVKGEQNLRRCFYKEERFEEFLNDGTPNAPVASEDEDPPPWKFEPKPKNYLNGGEIFGSGEYYDDVLDIETIRQLYKTHKINLAKKEQTLIRKRRFKKMQSSSSIEGSSENIDDAVVDVKNKVNSVRNESLLMNHTDDSNNQITNTDTKNMITLKVNKGSFFYNEKDALDVTSGNSSYSSSEEFLSQCTDTIVSLDLTPYIDCKAKLSDGSKENTWHFTVNESDFYYFIFFSDNSIEANVISFKLKINRALYDVSEDAYDQMCSNASECYFPFSFTKSTGVIVDYGSDTNPVSKLDDLQTYELTAICQPRSIVYTVFILLVPFIIFIFAFR